MAWQQAQRNKTGRWQVVCECGYSRWHAAKAAETVQYSVMWQAMHSSGRQEWHAAQGVQGRVQVWWHGQVDRQGAGVKVCHVWCGRVESAEVGYNGEQSMWQ